MSSKRGLFLLFAGVFLFKILLLGIVGSVTVFASTAGVFGGMGTPENIGNILCNKNAYPFTERASLVGLAYQRPLEDFNKTFHPKVEFQFMQHFRIQTLTTRHKF